MRHNENINEHIINVQVIYASSQSHQEQLEESEQDFIQASTVHTKEEIHKKRRQQRRIIFGVTIFAIVALILAGLAWFFAANAKQAQKEATKQAHIALVRQLAAQTLPALQNPNSVNGYADTAALLAVQATKIKEGKEESISNMLRTLQMRGHLNSTLQGHSNYVYSVAFSPDGSKVVSGSWDNTVRLWDAETGKAIGEPWQGHSSSVSSVAFSPNGSKVVSGSLDNAVRLWDVGTGRIIGEAWRGHSSSVRSVAFSPDGIEVVSGSGDDPDNRWDYMILIWDVGNELSWKERLCRVAGRNFTQKEWQKYLGDRPYEQTCSQYPIPIVR